MLISSLVVDVQTSTSIETTSEVGSGEETVCWAPSMAPLAGRKTTLVSAIPEPGADRMDVLRYTAETCGSLIKVPTDCPVNETITSALTPLVAKYSGPKVTMSELGERRAGAVELQSGNCALRLFPLTPSQWLGPHYGLGRAQRLHQGPLGNPTHSMRSLH